MIVAAGWHSIDWGNAPAWVGSILSGVSVILALSILMRDRRDRVRQQAMQLGVNVVNEAGPGDKKTLYVNLHNASPSVFVQPGVIGTGNSQHRDLAPVSAYMRLPAGPESVTSWLLKPGDTSQIAVALAAPHEHYDFTLSFGDASGHRWERNLRTFELTEEPKSRRSRRARLKRPEHVTRVELPPDGDA